MKQSLRIFPPQVVHLEVNLDLNVHDCPNDPNQHDDEFHTMSMYKQPMARIELFLLDVLLAIQYCDYEDYKSMLLSTNTKPTRNVAAGSLAKQLVSRQLECSDDDPL